MPIGNIVPETEFQARLLTRLEPEQQREAWAAAVGGDQMVTAMPASTGEIGARPGEQLGASTLTPVRTADSVRRTDVELGDLSVAASSRAATPANVQTLRAMAPPSAFSAPRGSDRR